YPNAKISEINAAIGGTGSDLGVFRCNQDVIAKHPDLVFVEFAVNDGGAPPANIWRAMEGIVRQIRAADPTIDICYVYTLALGFVPDYLKGMCNQSASADEMLAEYYGIPSINMALRTVQLEGEGKLIYTDAKDPAGNNLPVPDGMYVFTHDSCHPTDAGHTMYTEVITAGLKEIEAVSKSGPRAMPAPWVVDNLEHAKLVPIEQYMLTPGWVKLNPQEAPARNYVNFMPELWQADKPGEKLSFKFKGTTCRIYEVMGPDGANVNITVDGKASGPRGMFDSYCSWSRKASLSVAEGLPEAVHEVTIEVLTEQPDRSSVTNIEKTKPNFDPKKYDGTRFLASSIMLIGDIVK
ncbi:MAG: GDSL-type esterase/lipase family protein, partial [Armatimonadota bacterium]